MYYTNETGFFKGHTPFEFAEIYGTPLYVYNEDILRKRCREIKSLVDYDKFYVNYSTKANSNLEFLKIVHSEGLYADAMSPGEIFVLQKAGFENDRILYISNNVDEDEMMYAIERGITVSIDSLCQLEQYGRLNNGGKVCIRINTGVGAGHHEKVVTGGKKTKFGINIDLIPQVKELLNRYNLTLCGINQHIGSLFMDGEQYIKGIHNVFQVAMDFPDIEFIDFGGGFGIPYKKQECEGRLDLAALGKVFTREINAFVEKYGRKINVKVEPGRYISAECCVLLGKVTSVKHNYTRTYVGCDIGFNVLQRPIMYGSHHDIEVFRNINGNCVAIENNKKVQSVVGNICESGDILADERLLPEMKKGDMIVVCDAGAYGFCMSSNYNNRLKPAEVLICSDGSLKLIRRRDTFEDLIRNF